MKGKKTGGRQKGSLNKVTIFTKEVIADLLAEYTNSGMMSKDFNALEPKERVDAILKMASFVVPKPQSVDMSITNVKSSTIDEVLMKLAEENEF